MYVCLCTGVTNEMVADVVQAGAVSTKAVAQECGAGSQCGRCRATIRAIIAAYLPADRAAAEAHCSARRPRRGSTAQAGAESAAPDDTIR
jgi:bacterioferritin-associated ferredoxin